VSVLGSIVFSVCMFGAMILFTVCHPRALSKICSIIVLVFGVFIYVFASYIGAP